MQSEKASRWKSINTHIQTHTHIHTHTHTHTHHTNAANLNKQQIDACTPYWPILSVLLTLTDDIA